MKRTKLEKIMAIIGLIVIFILIAGIIYAGFTANMKMFFGFTLALLVFTVTLHIIIQFLKRDRDKRTFEDIDSKDNSDAKSSVDSKIDNNIDAN